ncbi:hypothetical protein FE257_003502 [Aspergillus nanangensis]|uniref:Zn(2)-C6 fungal-type domain-containing protein n=1 Tax=Aspergillus nanangensis TaxID=2582783 RepID=A0AAD4CBI5_ASPNN|nr:hypothetical protein FE257_003502 [Aspergillus nanangensis]
MGNSNEEKQPPRLPACQSCYTKKAKCDNKRPKCAPCTKSDQACLTVSLDGHKPISREFIYELEQNVRTLQTELADTETTTHSVTHSPESVLENTALDDHNGDDAQNRNRLENDVSLSPNFTEGAGISFMSLLFTDTRWREQNQKLLHNLSKPATIIETEVQPNPLPEAEEALIVFNSYLSGSHIQNPFLLRRYVQDFYGRVFPDDTGGSPVHLSKHDEYRVFMILAIGSTALYRAGQHTKHPYGYFLTAMQKVGTDLLSRGLDSIQDLLLVSRFGIYHHIGTSIWEIIQLCMRMCIEQGLHRGVKSTPRGNLSLLQEQLQRRVFWQCYMMNRYSSVMLDRPPAITDKDIDVGFPADADDEELDAAEKSGSFLDLDAYCRVAAAAGSTPMRTTEMSVLFLCLRLRKITSKIHTKFQQKANSPGKQELLTIDLVATSGMIYSDLDELLMELEEWRMLAPVFETPRCLYETQEWYDLLLMRERLLLVRKAIDLVPKRNKTPPQDLLSLCLQFAVGTIMTFCPLFEQRRVTYTRSYFQTLFTAGLSVMFCVSVATDHDSDLVRSAKEAVETCERILKIMVKELPDAIPYVAVYEALRVDILGKLNRILHDIAVPVGISLEHRVQLDHTNVLGESSGPGQCTGQVPVQFPPQWPLPDPTLEAPMEETHQATLDHSLLSWDLFGDRIFWNIEAGMLGEYVYGDPNASALLDDSI